ncbi:hypothetical protein [Bacillus solitudinis]|uniref:hypothetical protein n=1 Tax=Bacillus solitudinis TaxID=2014074 RepID=UPI000C231EAD|nr:hypothetical protein [Bacillus solitudinis]
MNIPRHYKVGLLFGLALIIVIVILSFIPEPKMNIVVTNKEIKDEVIGASYVIYSEEDQYFVTSQKTFNSFEIGDTIEFRWLDSSVNKIDILSVNK